MFIKATGERDGRHKLGEYICDICHKTFVKRIRNTTRKRDLCGCAAHNKTHGGANTPEYGVWKAMLARCTDPKMSQYADYGGRGISVVPAWKDFHEFRRDMGTRPTAQHTIERVDLNGPYCKSNCVWADRATQARNTRSNVWVNLNGVRTCVTDVLAQLELPVRTYYRYQQHGATPVEALNRLAERYGRVAVIVDIAGGRA